MHSSHKMEQDNTPPPAVIIFGCGNLLLGDDGFGPAVIEVLNRLGLPGSVVAIDAGTGIREYLLDYLMLPSLRPQLLVVVDAGYEPGLPAGTVQVGGVEAMTARKINDFSLHQFPSVNLLAELQEEAGVEVKLVTAQSTPGAECLQMGLSQAMQAAVADACRSIGRLIEPYTSAEVAAR